MRKSPRNCNYIQNYLITRIRSSYVWIRIMKQEETRIQISIHPYKSQGDHWVISLLSDTFNRLTKLIWLYRIPESYTWLASCIKFIKCFKWREKISKNKTESCLIKTYRKHYFYEKWHCTCPSTCTRTLCSCLVKKAPESLFIDRSVIFNSFFTCEHPALSIFLSRKLP